MNNLEIIKVNGECVTSSRQIAENFGKEHKNVLADIRELFAAENSAAKLFIESTYINRGKKYPEFLMNRDGFTLLAMGFNGSDATKWKLKYINAFNEMEKQVTRVFSTEEIMLHTLQKTVALQSKVDQHETVLAAQDKDIKQLKQLVLTPITKHPQTQTNWYDVVSEGFNKLLNSGAYYLEGLGGHANVGNANSTKLGYVRVGPAIDKIFVQGSVLRSALSTLEIVLPSTNAVLVTCDLVIPSIKGVTHVIKYNGESLRVLQLNIAI